MRYLCNFILNRYKNVCDVNVEKSVFIGYVNNLKSHYDNMQQNVLMQHFK